MTFTREELALIQTALHQMSKSPASVTPWVGDVIAAKRLCERVQSYLLADEVTTVPDSEMQPVRYNKDHGDGMQFGLVEPDDIDWDGFKA